MAVAVASSQHCFKNQAAPTVKPPRRKNSRPGGSKPKPAGCGQPDPQSRGPGRSPAGSKNLSMGQVRILKRGEKLNETATEIPIVAAAPTAAPLPQPDSNTPEKGAADSKSYGGDVKSFFAGTSFFTVSPPPSSVPIPKFCLKKNVVG